MASLARKLKNTSYLQNSLTLLLFFASWGIWWSFFQIWLGTELDFDGSRIGVIYSVNSLTTLLVMFFYGTMQDRLGAKRHLAILASSFMTLFAPFFIFVYRPLLENAFMVGVILGAAFLSVGFLAAVGLFEALAERFSRRYGFEYGQARMWGSFGYALVALAAGILFNINPNLNFVAASVFGLICLLIQVFWKPPKTGLEGDAEATLSTPGFGEMIGLLRMPSLWVVILFVLFTWTFYTVYDQQMFPEFYVGLFATQEIGNQTYGVLNSAQVFLEAAMMGVVPILMRKFGVKTTLMMGVTVMCLRILGSAIFDDPVIVSVVKMFHALEVPLFILAIFRYFTLHFNSALSATLYMVGFQISAQIGNVILSTPLGVLRDNLGFQPVFYVISGVVLVAGLFGFFFLKSDDQDVHGDPLPTGVQGGQAGHGDTAAAGSI